MSSIVKVPACWPPRRCASEDGGRGDRGGIQQSAILSLNLHPQLLPTNIPPPPHDFTLSESVNLSDESLD